MRPNLQEDVRSLSDFKRNTATMLRRMRRTKRPLVLTVNGKTALVVHDPGEYERLLAKLEFEETSAAIQRGLADADAGRVKPADEVIKHLRAKLRH
jgi:prevent-host-death family protein